MIQRNILSILAVAFVLDSTDVAAMQSDINNYKYSREESDRAFEKYSSCIVKSRSGEAQAMKFLRHVPNTPGWAVEGNKLTTPECLSGLGTVKMRFNLTALRPAMFAALYRRRFGKTVPVSLAREPQLTLANLFDGPTTNYPADAFAQLSFGNCVVRADAGAVHALLMAQPWSQAEDAALPAVKQAMGACLNPGKSLHLTRAGTRGVLAEAMYDLSSLRAARLVSTNPSPVEAR